MSLMLRLLLTLLLLQLCPSASMAQSRSTPIQKMPESARKLIAVHVTGSRRYSQDEVVAASGLIVGGIVGEEDFNKAARILGQTGAFTDIGYSYSYSPAGTKLELKLTDTKEFVPARFEDFVWFPDADLRREIKERVPLFNGELPISGRLPDEVSDVLQALLVEKGVPGHVDYLRYSSGNGPIESINYSVADVLIRVRKIEFTGAGSAELPLLEAAAERLPDREYASTRLDVFAQRQLLPVYHARGYLKASLGPPQPKVVKDVESDNDSRNETLVDVTFAVNPGQQYKLTGLEWAGNREIATDKLQSMIQAQPGQPANLVRLVQDLEDVQRLYGTRGYINASITPEPQFDDAAGTVSIRLEVKEDYIYRMGELEFRGLDNSLTSKLRAAWRLRPGDVYDAAYVNQYIPEANKLLPRNLDWGVAVHVTPNVREKTVDVDLQYTARALK
jgi:outer membrane protein assembly factor BamA